THTPTPPHTNQHTPGGAIHIPPTHTHTRTIIDPSQRATKTPVITGITHIFIHSFITHTHTHHIYTHCVIHMSTCQVLLPTPIHTLTILEPTQSANQTHTHTLTVTQSSQDVI